MRKKHNISAPDDSCVSQPGLFGENVDDLDFPHVLRTKAELQQMLQSAGAAPIGIDLEFDDNRPTIIGLSCNGQTGAIRWDEGLAREALAHVERRNTTFVAHSAVDADRPEIEKALGVKTPLSLWDCSLLTHYFCNMHFTKMPAKEEDAEEAGSLGLMNLWAAASMVTPWPMWKACRGTQCSGKICPKHDPIGYCAMDSLAGLEIFTHGQETLRAHGFQHKIYREQIALNDICRQMTQRGVYVDMRYVRENLEGPMEQRKEALFAPDEHGNPQPYNPRSPKQVLEYFEQLGVPLKSNNKSDVYKALSAYARKNDINLSDCGDSFEEAQELSANKVFQELFRLYQYKKEGKGVNAWFDEKYLRNKQYESRKLIAATLHPRFIPYGTATMRLSSSSPNLQNVPARGFGALVRKAITAFPDEVLLKIDASQLELRKVLHCAGVALAEGRDIFYELADAGGVTFDAAAKLYTPTKYAKSPRDAAREVAKSVVHAADYGEGMQLLTTTELEAARIQKEIRLGSRLHFPDWTVYGLHVTFTGANLANRLFGEKSEAARKNALELQSIYFSFLSEVQRWQRQVTSFIETHGYVQTACGTYLTLNLDPLDNVKVALATIGQGEGALFIEEMMLRVSDALATTTCSMILQVHDELVLSLPEAKAHAIAKDIKALMQSESLRFPGFRCPMKAFIGKTWLEEEMETV